MLAYHSDQAVKDKYITRIREHRSAERLLQGYGYWKEGKGCAVGCTIELQSDPHTQYEKELGIPERIAHLEDAIFEGLPPELAMAWPERFLGAITPGADLSLVWHQFAAWLLTDSGLLEITDINRDAINAVAELHRRAASGELWNESAARSAAWSAAESAAWSAAESAAESAAWSARSAARSAAWSAAESAARSAWSAWSAARSAWSAWSAARSAAFEKMADKLIELLSAAPVN